MKIESCCRIWINLNSQHSSINTLTHSSNHSSVVIYSLVIRSFSLFSPFQKGKNKGNISKNDTIRNDATSSPEGAQGNGGDKYATLSERWSKLAKIGVIPHIINSNFRAKRQASHRKISLLGVGTAGMSLKQICNPSQPNRAKEKRVPRNSEAPSWFLPMECDYYLEVGTEKVVLLGVLALFFSPG